MAKSCRKPKRRITVTSSLNKISTDQMENAKYGSGEGGGVTAPAPIPFLKTGFWTNIERRLERFLHHLGYFFHVKNALCRIPIVL
jgi:hypothetical protein